MRYGAGHKAHTRKKLLEEAARAIRAEGPERVSVAQLMSEAGMTHGGFYAHFASKDDLVARSISEMFEQARAAFRKRTEGFPPAAALAKYVDFYLSAAHCAQPQAGCPLPALAADVSRLGPAARKQFEKGTLGLLRDIAALFGRLGHDRKASLELATSLLAELAGAISIARAVAGPAMARQVRSRSRATIRKRFGIAE